MDMHSSSQSYELAELKQAFLMLTSVSKKMESSYERLKAQAEELKEELCEKNARLVVSQQEQQRLESFLEGILQNMPVGIVVTDKEGSVRLVNQKAKDILDGGKRELLGVPYTSPIRCVLGEEKGAVRVQLFCLVLERISRE